MMEFYNKHYIRVVDGIVTKGFSDAFEEPTDTDICINERGGRHFELNGEINPPLFDERMCHIYRYDTELRKATKEELEAEWQAMQPTEPDPTTDDILNALLGVQHE